MQIIGGEDFINWIKKSLLLLKIKSENEYCIIISYIGEIREWYRSGMEPYKSPPLLNLSRKTAFKSLTWCASSIAHDAYHSKLYHEYLSNQKEKKLQVPDNVWMGTEIELECIEFQIKVSKKIGATREEIKYLKSLDGTHWSIPDRDY